MPRELAAARCAVRAGEALTMGPTHASMSFCVPVGRWAAWAPGFPGAAAAASLDVSFVEPLLRRRLSPLARMALHVANACAEGLPAVRLVFASRHGELNRTMAMLRQLARHEPLSPTAFGLSVHNTAAAIFSIARQDPSAATAIAAGEETFGYGLLEAFCQWRSDADRPVLYVFADEPLPVEYADFTDRPESPHAIAVLLTAEASRRVTLSVGPNADAHAPAGMQSLAFLPCLTGETQGDWKGTHRTWTWH